MKASQKDPEKLIWDQMRSPSSVTVVGGTQSKALFPKLLLWLILSVSVTYILYTFKLMATPHSCSTDYSPFHHHRRPSLHSSLPSSPEEGSEHRILSDAAEHSSSSRPALEERRPEDRPRVADPGPGPTNISHIVFGIGGSASLWDKRKEYIKVWYNKSEMRGIVWLEAEVPTSKPKSKPKPKPKPDDNDNDNDDNNIADYNTTTTTDGGDDGDGDGDGEEESLPEIRISSDTSKFRYNNKQGHRSAIRISRIVSETLRLGLKDVRWFVMGDDDTVFVKDNLIRVLNKYDHRQYYYIGSNSESHLQNIYFSYAMAYGGGGFAISYPLAVALEKIQDRCIQRYPVLYGSDDRIQACMAELGVPLTKELGFHQYDVYGNLFGLLAAHPVTPFVSLHHLDVVEPIFPNVTQVQALQRLTIPMKLDSAGLMQQSVCYYKAKKWTISVSWGFAVQIIRGVLSPREMEMPTRTFLNWYRRADYTAYAFNTRPVARNPCQKPFVYYMSNVIYDEKKNRTVSEYLLHHVQHPLCRWHMTEPSTIERVIVYKKPDPQLWTRSPRRNCCRVLKSRVNGTMLIDVGVCKEGEVIEV